MAELEALAGAAPRDLLPEIDAAREQPPSGQDPRRLAAALGLALDRPPPLLVPVNTPGTPRPPRHRASIRAIARELRLARRERR